MLPLKIQGLKPQGRSHNSWGGVHGGLLSRPHLRISRRGSTCGAKMPQSLCRLLFLARPSQVLAPL